jgi:hypothetical protein
MKFASEYKRTGAHRETQTGTKLLPSECSVQTQEGNLSLNNCHVHFLIKRRFKDVVFWDVTPCGSC